MSNVYFHIHKNTLRKVKINVLHNESLFILVSYMNVTDDQTDSYKITCKIHIDEALCHTRSIVKKLRLIDN